jgi:hypothetical protein
MSDLIPMGSKHNNLSYKLLATVSSMALMVSAEAALARDAGDGHPTFWIEAGGAFDELSSDSDLWLAPNTPAEQSNPTPPFGTLPKAGYDLDLKFTVAPHDSDWRFSVGLIYGRALRGPKTTHDQTYKSTALTFIRPPKYVPTNYDFANTSYRSTTSHLLLDFQVGKDVGLGMFGGKSTLNLGIRWAKLNESSNGHMSGATNASGQAGGTQVIADFRAGHSLDGIGPSVSWYADTPFAGSQSDGLSLDWGINAALLIGKQKTRTDLHTSSYSYRYYSQNNQGRHQLTHSTPSLLRSKTVVVPNLGGFAGISWRMPNAKVSVGYKADFFFDAIDVGIATRETATRGFYGPFATVSFGLGG